MRLYSRNGVATVAHPEWGEYTAGADGSIDVPEAFGAFLHRTHHRGVQVWETDPERSARLAAEEDARRRDPATLLAAVEAVMARQAEAPMMARQAEAPETPAAAKKRR